LGLDDAEYVAVRDEGLPFPAASAANGNLEQEMRY
jgi:hypothetical protein